MQPKTFKKLYKRTKRGQIAWYQITVEFKRNYATVTTQKAVAEDAKSQSDVEEIHEGVNIGKANETTFQEQANNVATSRYNRLLDEGYKPEIPKGDFNTDASGNAKPMLALKFSSTYDTYPAYIQPKLDGIRCIAQKQSGKVSLISRKGKPLSIPHVEAYLQKHLKEGVILDGELYVHKQLTFQQVISASKKVSELTYQLQYHVYDKICTQSTFQQRTEFLNSLSWLHNNAEVRAVPTIKVRNLVAIKNVAAQFIEDGYEGVMVRTPQSNYTPGYRSEHLLKYKEFSDAEFKVVNVLEATGRDEGTAVFTCSTKNGVEFNCRPQGTFEERASYFKNKSKLIGKKLTVRFQGFTDDGVPRFPVGVAIRDYE